MTAAPNHSSAGSARLLFQVGFDAFLNGLTFSQALRRAYRPEGDDFFELSRGFNAAEELELATRPRETV
jgi:hypothetical protein